jgi:hypothetical protein
MATNKTSIILTADDRTRAAFASAKSNMQGLQQAGVKLNGILSGIGLGAGISSAGLLAFVKTSIDAADAFTDLSARTGVAIETLAGLEFAAEMGDTSLDAISTSIGRLNKAMGEAGSGNTAMIKSLAALGVTAKDPAEALNQLADYVKQTQDPTQRAAELSRVLGKSYQELLPLLEGGGDQLRAWVAEGQKFNPVTTEMANQAAMFVDQMSRFKREAGGTGVIIANELLPTLNAIVGGFDDGTTSGTNFAEMLGGALRTPLQAIAVIGSDVAFVFKTLGRELGGLGAQMASIKGTGLRAGDWKEFAAIGKMIDADSANARKALDAYQARIMGLGAKPPAPGSKPGASGTTDIRIPAASGGKSAAAPKLDTIDPFGNQRRAAEEAAFNAQIEAQNDAFDALAAIRDEQIAQDEQTAASLGRLRAEYIAILDPLQMYRDKLDEVDTLVEAGLLNADQAATARLYWQEQMDAAAGFGEEVKKVASELDLFWEEAAKNMQSSLADYLFDPFADGMDGMLKGFARTLQRMAAEAVAADLTRALFGNASNAGGGQNLLGAAASLFGFANGGSFRVGGSGGTDSQLVAFKASPDETVTIKTPAQQRQGSGGGNITVNFQVTSPDAASFRKSSGQIQADLARAVQGARRYS